MSEGEAIVALGIALHGMLLAVQGIAWMLRIFLPNITEFRRAAQRARDAEATALANIKGP